MRGHHDFSEENIQLLFGHEAAEDEDPERLKEYYFKSKTYGKIYTDLPLRILVGHKGIGKSALFQIAILEDKGSGKLPILIRPDDVVDIGLEESNFLRQIHTWKGGLSQIIASKVLAALGLDDENVISKAKQMGGKLLSFLVESVKGLAGKINLQPANKALIDNFLKTKKVVIYIDDLDRGWEGRKEEIKRISALLNAVRDMSREFSKQIYFRVALRSDVYFLYRTSDESTDKIEGSVVWFSWTNHEILVLLAKRVSTFFGKNIDENELLKMKQRDIAFYLDPVIERVFSGQGHWENAPMHKVLMSLIRKRPRDLVKLCTLAAGKAAESNSNVIRTVDLTNIFEKYSQDRIQDTVNEYRSELPNVQALILNMKPSTKERKAKLGYTYTTDALGDVPTFL